MLDMSVTYHLSIDDLIEWARYDAMLYNQEQERLRKRRLMDETEGIESSRLHRQYEYDR